MATIPASENEFPEVLFAEGAAPAAPGTGLVKAYAKSDGLLYSKDDAGAETALGAGAHVADTTDAHDASAISFDPTGLSSVTGTEVQTAIEELDAAVAAGGISPTIMAAKGDVLGASANDTPAITSVGADGTVLTAASGQSTGLAFALPPGYELDYVEKTSNTSPTQTAEASADTIITGNAVTFDGSTVVFVEFFAPGARADTSAAGRQIHFWLFDGSSSIGEIANAVTPAAATDTKPIVGRRRLTPSAASHTYSIRATVSAGTGLVIGGAGGAGNFMPCFYRIVKV